MNTKDIQKDMEAYFAVYDYSKMTKEQLVEQIKQKANEMNKEQLIECVMFADGEHFKILPEITKKLVKIREDFEGEIAKLKNKILPK